MSTLILFYSYGGTTRRLAEQLARQQSATLCEVRDQNRPSRIGTIFRVPAALKQRQGKIYPIDADFSLYDQFIVMGPIWAGHPAPPVNSILHALPKGAKVELRMVSSGGSSQRDKLVALAESLGLTVTDCLDIAAATAPAAP